MHTRPTTAPTVLYRERLSPSLWTLLSAAVVAPMVSLVFVPLDATLALVAGLLVAVALVALLVLASPVVEVRGDADGGELRVGRAHIPVHDLGDPQAFTGEDARQVRGPGLPRTAWHLLRGGIDPVVAVPNLDERDPVSVWVVSTRTPDRFIAAIRSAQRA